MTAYGQSLIFAAALVFFLILILIVSTRYLLRIRKRNKQAAAVQPYDELIERISLAQEASAASVRALQDNFKSMSAKLDVVERLLRESERKMPDAD